MGATNFHDRITARTAAEGYGLLVARARNEYGNEIYNGTISTTDGFKMVSMGANETVAECERRLLDADDDGGALPGSKWGPAACVDLGPDPAKPGCRRFAFFGWAAT